ncbi:selenium-dependent molybdenum cofactor biosynthesis protein YqeB [Eubacterium aggregans]|uniref:selenium-dependent molybdenum cofactor biosynthesis protein YqeB n=1 Tax=Eubacterium aggregans TaxID=81409 RepID=UPI003F378746
MRVIIKGAGEMATGVAHRLHQSGFEIIMTDLTQPTTIRRRVPFSRAIGEGKAEIEGVVARRTSSDEIGAVLENGDIAVVPSRDGSWYGSGQGCILVDAVMAKYNTGTAITDGDLVIALGPGFEVLEDCHAVVEASRGHHLGKVYYQGCALAPPELPERNNGPRELRMLRAPGSGLFYPLKEIGQRVEEGEIIAQTGDLHVAARVSGILRGILPKGTLVHHGMKAGEIDPDCQPEDCFTISAEARAVGGAVLEAILHMRNKQGVKYNK